jgi:hypothetical protein
LLLVTLAVKTVLSISQKGINQITLNKKFGINLNMDIINASRTLAWAVDSGAQAYVLLLYPLFF